MDFKDRLREEISFSGLSYKELSAKSGVSKRTIISYVSEQSCMPSADAAVKLAKSLNTSVEYLINGEKDGLQNSKFNEDSRKLLHTFSRMPASQKKLLLSIADDIVKLLE